ncbi:type II secretion system ATPase GspE [Desulfohalobiaceae bacterium Ax17]|uniref:type II secretion system ATPase GspE n=1 Tax=Desulfovulcanus ferrireducens TaxID=2831190 RepID=UPI00207BBB88|nr:type II secretion system ATPase GspE [Desulfovulcanus ferrireducens]MBT8762580.1 type II secretion system ATPase GspE [Desulfovulcanus ferrireducens]
MRTSLTSLLIDHGLISEEEVKHLVQEIRDKNRSMLGYLLQSKKIREEDLLPLLAKELGLVFINKISEKEINAELVQKLPLHYLKKHCFVPLRLLENHLVLAVNLPFFDGLLADLKIIFQTDSIEFQLCPKNEIITTINRVFGQIETEPDEIIDDLNTESEDFLSELEQGSIDLLDEADDSPVIKLVNHIITQAVRGQASDIHIEPYEHNLKVRFRLDGILYDFLSLPRKIHPHMVSRVKIMAGLNIAEKRLPQDGRIEIKIGNRQVDLRVSSLPTSYGERIVLRLLEKGARLLALNDIGLNEHNLTQLKQLLTLSHGIILVTGPTGSGKTTTLYSALNHINSPGKNILTIEDPIEYRLEGIGQMQVNPKIGLTFSSGLRSMVRQDPDVILVGEIRDLETAEIAIQAALTGHLVFSTLHTNDAPSAITRLIDMGIEPFLLSTAVRAIIAQRLVRILCPYCKQQYRPSDIEAQQLGVNDKDKEITIGQAKGCEHCLNTGYKGRTGIFEFIYLNNELQSLILKSSDANVIRNKAIQGGMKTLRQDGIEKVLKGLTTVSEVLRVAQL